MTRVGLFLTMICAVAGSAYAAEVHWSELPKVLKGKTIVVEMNRGGRHEGRFVSASPDSIVLKDGQAVTIARDDIMSISRKGHDTRFSHVKSLGDFVLSGFVIAFVAEPFLAFISIPIATVGGAVGAPITFIWDLCDLAKSPSEYVVILPDPAPGVSQ